MQIKQEQVLKGVTIKATSDGVVAVRLTGLVTPKLMQDAKREVLKIAAPISCFVIDFSAAVLAADGDSLDALLNGPADAPVAGPPGACVVAAPFLNLFLGHSQRMAGIGITRRVFMCRARAFDWAGRQAGLAAAG